MDEPQIKNPSQPDIASPFSGIRARPPVRSRSNRSKVIVCATVCAFVLFLGVGTLLAIRHLNDPYRKLEDFPVSRYFENYSPLEGLKFRSSLRVEADLGWREGIGRIMVFTPTNEEHELVALITSNHSNEFFDKGQSYTAELEVKEGGLIYVESFRKN